jgi:hypothetical protein
MNRETLTDVVEIEIPTLGRGQWIGVNDCLGQCGPMLTNRRAGPRWQPRAIPLWSAPPAAKRHFRGQFLRGPR